MDPSKVSPLPRVTKTHFVKPRLRKILDVSHAMPALNDIAFSAIRQKRVCCEMGFGKADEIGKRTKAMVKEKGLEKKKE